MKRAGKEWLSIGTPGETYWDESVLVFRLRLYLYLNLERELFVTPAPVPAWERVYATLNTDISP